MFLSPVGEVVGKVEFTERAGNLLLRTRNSLFSSWSAPQRIESLHQSAALVQDEHEDIGTLGDIGAVEDLFDIGGHVRFCDPVPACDDEWSEQLDERRIGELTSPHAGGVPSAMSRVQISVAVGDNNQQDRPLLAGRLVLRVV